MLKWRIFVSGALVAILPVSLRADDTGAAMLRSNGGVVLNKNPAPISSALFPDDLVETQKSAAARIEATGSTADINSETLIQFEDNELDLEHGSLSVTTSRGMRVRIGCVIVTPVNTDWTRYDVSDLDGKVTVAALKNDVYIESRSSNPQQAKPSAYSDRVTVGEGEQKTRREKCGGADIKTPRAVAGTGAIMNSPWALGAGIVGVGVLTCWALCRGDDPVSPSKP